MILYVRWLSNSFYTFQQTLEIDPSIEFCAETMANSSDSSGFFYVGY